MCRRVPTIAGNINNTIGLAAPTVSWQNSTTGNYCGSSIANVLYIVTAVCVDDCAAAVTTVSNIAIDALSINLPIDGMSGLWSITVTASMDVLPSVTSAPVFYRLCAISTQSSPALIAPPNYYLNSVPQMNMTWQQGVWESYQECDIFTSSYEVVLAVSTSSEFSEFTQILNASASSYTDLPTDGQWVATAEGNYYWRVEFTKWFNAGPTVSIVTTSVINMFSVCLNKAPVAPTLIAPVNHTAVNGTSQTVYLSWSAVTYTAFGHVCTYANVPFAPSVILYLDTVNPPVATQFSFSWDSVVTPDLSTLVSNNVTYYWQVVFANGLDFTSSNVESFTVFGLQDASPTHPNIPVTRLY